MTYPPPSTPCDLDFCRKLARRFLDETSWRRVGRYARYRKNAESPIVGAEAMAAEIRSYFARIQIDISEYESYRVERFLRILGAPPVEGAK